MPSFRLGAQDNNNKVTAVNNSGGGVAVDDKNNERSLEQQVSPSEVQYSSRTSVNDIQNNGGCSESSNIATDDISANTLSSIHNNNKDVNSNANQSITIKTKFVKNNNNVGTPTFNSKLSTTEQGTCIDDADSIQSYVSSLVLSIDNSTAVGDIIWKELLLFPLRQFNEILREVDAVDCLEDLALVIYGENGYVTTRGGYAQGMDGNYDPVVALLGQFETSYKRDNGLIPPLDDDDDGGDEDMEESGEDIEEDSEEMDEDELDGNDNGDVDFANSGGGIDMKCEGRGTIVTSTVDVMDDIHGSTSTVTSRQSCFSFPSLEEGKRSDEDQVTSEDILQESVEKITKPTASSSSLEDDVDFADSGGDIDTNVDMGMDVDALNALNASQHQEDTECDDDEMDEDELAEEATIAPPLDFAAIYAAVEACNNINATDIWVPESIEEGTLEKKSPAKANNALGKRKSDTNFVKENVEKRACIVDEPMQVQAAPQLTQLPVELDHLETAAAAYNANPIQLDGNNRVFSNRTLYRLRVTMPSLIDGNIGLNVQTNHVFARPQINSICNSSCLFHQIPPVFLHQGYLLVATEAHDEPCQSTTPKKLAAKLKEACSTSERTASLILAKPFIHTLQEAKIQLEEKLKLAANAPDFQGEVAQVFRDFLVFVYTHKDTPACKRFFFDNPEVFPTFEQAKKDAEGGGVYIGKLQLFLHLKFGTSLTNCNNRKEKQDLKESWMFCTLAEALNIVPSSFIDRLEAIDIPSLRPDLSKAVTKQQYCAILLIEGTLSCIRPTVTNNIGDRMLHVPPPSALEITNPHVPQSKTDEIRDEGFLKSGDKGHVVTSWATFPTNMYSLRDGSLDLPELFQFFNNALLEKHLPESTDFLTLFLYKGIFGQAFHGFTDCVKISPWITRVIKVVKKMIDIIREGDVLQQYNQHGTVDSETKSKLEECLADMIEFAKENGEYQPASDKEVAAGCVEVLEDLTKKLSLDTVIYIETSTYEALKRLKRRFYNKFFRGYKSVEVLKGNRLKFMKHKSQERHRFAVVGTPFVAYTIPKAATLEDRGTSLQSQNALLKVLASLGMSDNDEAEKILRRNESFFNFMDWSSEDGDAGEGTVQLALNLHLPPNMFRGHLPPGFSSLQRLLSLPYRTLLLFRLVMGPIMLKLLLDSRGGKIGPTGCLPIEVDEQTCNGPLAIGRFASSPCTCKQGGAQINMFKAQDQTDPLFGHLVCRKCLSTSHYRLRNITAEIEAYGIDINQIIRIQTQISAIIYAFATDSTLVPSDEVMKHVMQQNGLSVSDTNDNNLVSLLIEWSRGSKLQTFITLVQSNRPARLDTLVRGTKSFDFIDESRLGIDICKAQNGSVFFGVIQPDSPADQAGIISGDVPLVNERPIEYNAFRAMAAKRPLAFDVKRYAYQQFYKKSSKAYIHPQQLSLFNAGELREMLKIKAGNDKYLRSLSRSVLIKRLGTMIEEAQKRA